VGELVAQVDVVVHWVAETHVPRSIYDATTFFETGVLGTQVIVNAISEHQVDRFPHLSSLGNYGPVEIAPMTEGHPLNLSISYASAKAHTDGFVYSYCALYQRPEKVILRFVTGALMDEPLPVHGDEPHSRLWPYVQDPCRNLDRALHANLQQVGSLAINLGKGVDRTIEHVAALVVDKLGTSEISSL
jgi:dTDP-glucose 4,6-dehydratase